MKKQLLFITPGTILLLVLLSAYCFSQTVKKTNPVIKELILGVPKATDKNLYFLTDAISHVTGLKYNSFCQKHKLVLLTFDQKIYKGPKEVIDAIKKQKMNMPMFVKEGTFKEVTEMCKE